MWVRLDSIHRRACGNAVAVVVGSCSLQKSLELPSLRTWQTSRRISTFDNIFVEIDKTKVTIRQLKLLVPPLHAHDIRAWSVKGLNQARRKKRNKYARPLERVKQACEGVCCKMQHCRV